MASTPKFNPSKGTTQNVNTSSTPKGKKPPRAVTQKRRSQVLRDTWGSRTAVAEGKFQERNVSGRVPTTARYAPDARIMVNGSFEVEVCPDCGKRLSADTFLASFTTNLNLNSVPGSASLSFVVGRNQTHRLLKDGSPVFKEMSRIEIFVKSNLDHRKYYPVFRGIITDVGVDDGGDFTSLSVDCQDVLRLWELTRLLLNPATQDLIRPDSGITGSRLGRITNAKMNYDVFQWMVELSAYNVGGFMPPAQLVNVAERISGNISRKNHSTGTAGQDWQAVWREMLKETAGSVNIFGLGDSADLSLKTDAKETGPGSYKRRMTDLLDPIVREVIPYFQDAASETISSQPDYVSFLAIAQDLSERIHWEFFMDATGDLVFKPPLYNLDVRDYAPHVIKPIDIVNKSLGYSEAEVVTTCLVTGAINSRMQQGDVNPMGYFVDTDLVRRYGNRSYIDSEVPFIVSKEAAIAYAVSELDRLNALRMSGSLTIKGRPELRLGYPVYVESINSFLYVTGVSHSFTFGGSFDTTISYSGKRSYYEPMSKTIKKDKGAYRNVVSAFVRDVPDSEKSQVSDPAPVSQQKLKQGGDITKDEATDSQSSKALESDVEIKTIEGVFDSSQRILPTNTSAINFPLQSSDATEDQLKTAVADNQKFVKTGYWEEKQEEGKDVWAAVLNGKGESEFSEALLDRQPESDSEGFEIIGNLPYGAWNALTEDGAILRKGYENRPKPDSEDLNQQAAQKAATSKPEGAKETTSVAKTQEGPQRLGMSLATDRAKKASEMKIGNNSSEETLGRKENGEFCDCMLGEHNPYLRKKTKKKINEDK